MRRILHRYIFVELLKAFGLSTAALTLFLAIAYGLTELSERGLGPLDAGRLVFYFVPAMLVYAMPVGALLTTTLVYGRLASDNEIVACRASGVSMSTLLKPVIVLGLLIGVVNFVLFDQIIPWSRYRAENIGQEHMERIFFHRMRTHRHVSIGEFYITAGYVEGNRLYDVAIRYNEPGGENFVAYGKQAEVTFLPPEQPGEAVDGGGEGVSRGPNSDEKSEVPGRVSRIELARECRDARVVDHGSVRIRLVGVDAFDEGRGGKSSLLRGNPTIDRLLVVPRPLDPEEMSLAMLRWRYEHPEESYLHRLVDARGGSEASLYKIDDRVQARSLAEMHSRYATIVSCVLLVALGAALGTMFRHGHILTAFFVSLGPALFAIFSILLGVKMVKAEPEEMHRWVSMIWTGNGVVLVLDFLLVGRLVRR